MLFRSKNFGAISLNISTDFSILVARIVNYYDANKAVQTFINQMT